MALAVFKMKNCQTDLRVFRQDTEAIAVRNTVRLSGKSEKHSGDMFYRHSSGKRRLLLKRIMSICIALIMICGISVQGFASNTGAADGDAAGQPAPAVTYNFYVEGELYNTQTLKNGETLTEPAAPAKSGFNFEGWFTVRKAEINLQILRQGLKPQTTPTEDPDTVPGGEDDGTGGKDNGSDGKNDGSTGTDDGSKGTDSSTGTDTASGKTSASTRRAVQTGDETNLMLWMGMLGAAGCVLCGALVFLYDRKRKEADK